MTRFVFATQQVDPAHPTLGAAAAMVRALAARVDEVVVLASAAATETLPPNVRFRSFAAPTRALRGARFEAALVHELAHGRPIGFLAHMSPVYALLAAPILRPLRVPVLLWFTQQQAGPLLARAERRVAAILSVDERSVPLSSAKVNAIGHGIDLAEFACDGEPPPDGPLRLLSLGRYAEAKGHDIAIRALGRLVDGGVDAVLTVHGEEATPDDARVRAALDELARELRIDGRVRLRGPVPRPEVPALLRQTHVVVNATRGAAADKVVFEAAASCVPVVAASPVFDRILPPELRFPAGDAGALAARLAALPRARMPALRAAVEAGHSVEHWADAVLTICERIRGRVPRA
jgi:glycosyltransferase involved in cell wall biosynthesis